MSFDPHARVRDLDVEGIDVNMILPSGGVPAFAGLGDMALEQAMYRAYHRFLADYCRPYPERLTGVLLVSARDAAASVAGIRRCAEEDWPAGILAICPPALSLDDADWEPIWAAAQAHDLTVVIHSFTMTVPYPPGSGTRGTACSCSAPPATSGTLSATWPRRSGRVSSIAIRGSS